MLHLTWLELHLIGESIIWIQNLARAVACFVLEDSLLLFFCLLFSFSKFRWQLRPPFFTPTPSFSLSFLAFLIHLLPARIEFLLSWRTHIHSSWIQSDLYSYSIRG